MKTSDKIIRATHFIAMLMALVLLSTGAFLLGKTVWFSWSGMWSSVSLDNLIEGTIVRVLDTIIILEMIFVILNLDHKQHLNVGLALDVASTITVRELVLDIYSKHSENSIYMILLAISVLVVLRAIYSFSKRKTANE